MPATPAHRLRECNRNVCPHFRPAHTVSRSPTSSDGCFRVVICPPTAERGLDAVEVASHRQITILRSLAHLTLAAPQMPEEATSLAHKVLERRDGTRPRRLRRL